MFNPVSKESQLHGWQSGPKPKKPIAKKSPGKKYTCSDGSKVSQVDIDRMLAKIPPHPFYDRDHTISQQRCKQLKKCELIGNIENVEYSTREQHQEWERYASGCFEDHPNVVKRMLYVLQHDIETYRKRRSYISNYKVLIELPDA